LKKKGTQCSTMLNDVPQCLKLKNSDTLRL
jgi:hypothetical protein